MRCYKACFRVRPCFVCFLCLWLCLSFFTPPFTRLCSGSGLLSRLSLPERARSVERMNKRVRK